MIRLSTSVETWVSPTFSHPLVLGNHISYYFNHDKDRAPDQHVCQYNISGDIWQETYDTWQNAVGTSYYGSQMSSGTTLSTVEISIARFNAGDYRVLLLWFS